MSGDSNPSSSIASRVLTESRQARYWMITCPIRQETIDLRDTLHLRDPLVWVKGQQEVGDTGYHHWQMICGFSRPVSLRQAKTFFPEWSHLEVTRSVAADVYVWKDETHVPGSRFEKGLAYELY